MSDFELRRESIEITPDFNVSIGQFENLVRHTRLITPEMIAGYKITSPKMTKTEMGTYLSHFTGKYGSLTSFTFTCPFTDIEIDVAYKQGSFKISLQDGYYVAQFEFERVF